MADKRVLVQIWRPGDARPVASTTVLASTPYDAIVRVLRLPARRAWEGDFLCEISARRARSRTTPTTWRCLPSAKSARAGGPTTP